MTDPKEILRIFFRSKGKDTRNAQKRLLKLRNRLKLYHCRALKGKLEHWNNTTNGKLALILLFDQAPRIIFDKGPKQFQTESKARKITDYFLRLGRYKKLSLQQQMFVFLPYHHAENLRLQKKAYKIFKELYKKDPKQFSWIYKASKYHNITIKKFGRFPHRNKDVGRRSTKAEAEFLKKEWPKIIEAVWENN